MAAALGLLCVIGCAWMTLYAAFCWKSFFWSLLFCAMHLTSQMWLTSHFELYSHESKPADVGSRWGLLCTLLGVFMLPVPEIGLKLFCMLFNIGVISFIGSFLFLCVEKIYDEQITSATRVTRVTPSTVIKAILWKSIHVILRAWYTGAKKFAVLFILGAGCTIAGVWVRNMPEFGLTPFIVGNLCIVFSTFFLKEPSAQLKLMFNRMYDGSRVNTALLMIFSFVQTQLSLFWWDSVVLGSLFCVLYVASAAWYSLSYVNFGRFAVKKVLKSYRG